MGKFVDIGFETVVDKTISALKDDRFGVLCNIDAAATFAEKLDRDFWQYRILSTRNPQLAYQGLKEEIELGAFFRVTLSSTSRTTEVSS